MDIESFFSCVEESSSWLSRRVASVPKILVVLSAGLGGFVDDMQGAVSVDSSEIPHFPRARAEGHRGSIAFGKMRGVPVAAMSGRFHLYEGHAPHEIVFPYFVLCSLGAKILLTTNAVGGVARDLNAGDLMLVTDHINMTGVNPLVGLAVQRKSGQFTDMTEAYDRALMKIAVRTAKALKIELKKGVYMAVSGPSYETVAEVNAYRKMGADAVGMSTVPEVIAAKFLGMRVCSLSCVANPAADRHGGGMSHAEVLAAMNDLAPRALELLEGVVEEAGRT